MNTVKKAAVPNYSKAQEARIIESAPVNLAIAKELALEFGKSYQSVISKCGNLDVEYIKKAPAAKKVAKETKEQLVALVSKLIDRDCAGLEKATSKALVQLINGIQHVAHVPDVES